jgi:hypothetical protein
MLTCRSLLFMKKHIQIGNFSGKSSLKILFEFLLHQTQDTVEQTKEESRRDRQLNMT